MFHSGKLSLFLLLKTLLDSLTKILRQLSVAASANGLRIPCSEITFLQELLASIAKEVFLVIGLVEEFLTTSSDGLLAERAIVTEQLNVMSLAVWKTVILEVMGLDESLVTDMAREMVRMPNLTECSDGTTLARLTAFGAFLQQEDLVVRSAIVVTFEFVAVTALELDTAFFTSEMARVHELTLNEQVWANDRTIAHGALMRFSTDNANFLLHAIRAVDVFGFWFDFVALTNKIGTAADANEMLRVERESSLGINYLASNNVVTYLATLGVELHEVLLAVELVIRANQEATARERLRAVLTDEVVRVIVLAKSLGDLTNDGLMAHAAVRTNRDIVSHYLWLLLLHEEVRIIVTSGS